MLKVTAAIIEKDGKVLIAQRKKGDRFEGFWEFPGGKMEDGETPEECLKRELLEELGIEGRVDDFLCSSRHESPSLSVEILAYRVTHLSGDFQPKDHSDIKWVHPADMDFNVFTEPDRLIVAKLKKIYGA